MLTTYSGEMLTILLLETHRYYQDEKNTNAVILVSEAKIFSLD